MNQDSFTQKYQPQWQRFETWLDSQNTDIAKNKRPVSHDSVEIPHLYLQLCHHLSLAQSRHYSAHLIEYLNQLTLRGHQYLYQSGGRTLTGFLGFVFYDFPTLVRKEAKLFWLAMFLFYAPLIGVAAAIQHTPELVYSIIPPEQVSELRQMYHPEAEHIGQNRESATDFLMFGYYIKNNIGVGFRTFAGGMLYGIGTLFFLIYNGLFIGAASGHLIQIGYSTTFLSFVVGHGSFELTAIGIAGMAGLKLGGALIKPGQYSRIAALKRTGKICMRLMYGVILMLVIAAFLEAFWSSKSAIDPQIKYIVGGLLWAFVAVYFLFAGRGRAN